MTATKSTEYPFSDLPLVIDRGYQAGLVQGYAELSYFFNGEFGIEALFLDGHRERTALEREAELDARKLNGGAMGSPYIRKPVEIERGSAIYLMIMERLETDWRDSVQDHVLNAIQRDYDSAIDDYADHLNERRAV